MLTNIIGGLQGIIDHVLVGHLVGFNGNAAIGAAFQIFIVVIAFIMSIFSGMSVLVARFAGAGEVDKVNRTIYQSFLTAVGSRSWGWRPWVTSVPARSMWSMQPGVKPKRCSSATCSCSRDAVLQLSAARCARPVMSGPMIPHHDTGVEYRVNVVLIRVWGHMPSARPPAMGTCAASANGDLRVVQPGERWVVRSRAVEAFGRLGHHRSTLPVACPPHTGIAMNVAGVHARVNRSMDRARRHKRVRRRLVPIFSFITWPRSA